MLHPKKQLDEHIKNVFGGITISQIYSKIEPHKRFTHLQYKVSFSEDSLPELYIKVINSKNEEIMPELFFSSAQLNTVALSVFLGGALCAHQAVFLPYHIVVLQFVPFFH